MVGKCVNAFRERFTLVGSLPNAPSGAPRIEVYRLLSTGDQAPSHIRIDLPYTLGRAIEQE